MSNVQDKLAELRDTFALNHPGGRLSAEYALQLIAAVEALRAELIDAWYTQEPYPGCTEERHAEIIAEVDKIITDAAPMPPCT